MENNKENLSSYVVGLVNRVERLEKALKFYATKDFYEPWRKEDEDRTDAFSFIDLDGGETAREALEE